MTSTHRDVQEYFIYTIYDMKHSRKNIFVNGRFERGQWTWHEGNPKRKESANPVELVIFNETDICYY